MQSSPSSSLPTATGPAPEKRRLPGSFSIRWIIVALLVIAVLVGLASGLAFYWANAAGSAAQAAQIQAAQVGAAGDLRLAALTLSNDVDRLLLTRSPNTWAPLIQADLENIDQQINNLISQPPGVSYLVRVRNQAILSKLQDVQASLATTNEEILAAASQGLWGTAASRRQSDLGELESELSQLLDQLAANTRQDTENAAQQVELIQNAARGAWITVTLVAFGMSIAIGVFTLQRVVAPLRRLNSQVQRITAGDLTPIEPFQQSDEVGQLSRSIAIMSARLRDSVEQLERRVNERTHDLEQRSRELQTAAQVASQIAATDLSGATQLYDPGTSEAGAINPLQHLLDRSVSLIRERFELYYASLFLIDERGEFAVLQAGTGQAGQEMLRSGHRLRVGQTGIVGQVSQSGQARVALDVTQDPAHFKNPLLPETRSEAALPIKIAGRVIGALDVQSRNAAAFDQDLVETLQLIADQLAGAIQNARLLRSVQENLEEIQIAYGQADRQSWQRFIHGRQNLGYRLEAGQARPIYSSPTASDSASDRSLRLPLEIRGQQIAELEIWLDQDGAAQEAGLDRQQMEMLNALTGRIAQSLETARLYEEAQERLARQESINRLSASLGRSMEIEQILQNAARELSRLPQVSEAAVFLLAGAPPASALPQPVAVTPEDEVQL
jgi:GAF domain-containing protein